MTALHADGRKAQALEVYRAGRELMIKELGLEPSHKLRLLQRAVLLDEAVAEPPATVLERRSTPLARPAELPPDIADFTGRRTETDELCGFIGSAARDRPGTAVPVALVSGKAGVGKSALAIRVGHLLRARFTDGQIHVSLRGTQDHPEEPSDVLARYSPRSVSHRPPYRMISRIVRDCTAR